MRNLLDQYPKTGADIASPTPEIAIMMPTNVMPIVESIWREGVVSKSNGFRLRKKNENLKLHAECRARSSTYKIRIEEHQ